MPRWFRVKQSAEGVRCGSKEDAERRPLHDGENPLENDQANEQTGHGETVAANPVEIALGAVLGHENHDAGAAIKWRNREEIEGAEEQIQGKDDEKG